MGWKALIYKHVMKISDYSRRNLYISFLYILLSTKTLLIFFKPKIFCSFILISFDNFRSMIDAWHSMSHDHSLFPLIADYLLELMAAGCGSSETFELPFEIMDTGAGTSMKIVKPEVCSLAAAISEIIKVILSLYFSFRNSIVFWILVLKIFGY